MKIKFTPEENLTVTVSKSALDIMACDIESSVRVLNEMIAKAYEDLGIKIEKYNNALDRVGSMICIKRLDFQENAGQLTTEWLESKEGLATVAWMATLDNLCENIPEAVIPDAPEPVDFEKILLSNASARLGNLYREPQV